MRIASLLMVSVVVAGCATTRDVKITTTTVTPKVAVVEIDPPPPPKPIQWRLKQPVDKATGKKANTDVAAGFTTNDLVSFQGWVLSVSEREAQWNNRLKAANKTIKLISQGSQPASPTPQSNCIKDKKGKCK